MGCSFSDDDTDSKSYQKVDTLKKKTKSTARKMYNGMNVLQNIPAAWYYTATSVAPSKLPRSIRARTCTDRNLQKLGGTAADRNNFYDFMNNKKHIWGMGGTPDSKGILGGSKQTYSSGHHRFVAIGNLELAIQQAADTYNSYPIHETQDNPLVFTYAGHGEEYTGNWAITNGDTGKVDTVSLEDILAHWDRESTSYLLIISDSCYSGCWVRRMKSYHRKSKYLNVDVIASCQADELSGENKNGGFFTYAFLQALRDGVTTKQGFMARWRRTDQTPCFSF